MDANDYFWGHRNSVPQKFALFRGDGDESFLKGAISSEISSNILKKGGINLGKDQALDAKRASGA